MHYFLDAYNLLFRLLDKGEVVQLAREALIDQIGKKVNLIDLRVTLVFDSAYQPGWASSQQDRMLEIIYTSEGETADDWLIRYSKKLSTHPEITIVTSDKRLAVHLKVKGIKILSCEKFISFLNKRVRSVLKAPKESIAPPPKVTPLKKKVAKGSAEYYEKLFQDRLENETPPLPKKKVPKPLTKEKQKDNEKKCGESEEERWGRLFGA